MALPYLILAGVFGLISLYHVITFRWLPDYYIHQLSNSPHYENPRAVRCLERLAALPALGGAAANRQARFRLANAYRLTRRYGDAASIYTTLLAQPSNPTFRTIVHSRLAECLEGMKNSEGAAKNRAQASDLWPAAQMTTEGCMELGRLEEAANRYRQACNHYERALSLAKNSELKNQLHARLAVANFNAGDIADTIRWAEAGIASGAEGKMLIVLHSMAGLGYRNQGDLEAALAHDRRHYELAVAEGNPKRIAEALVKLAFLESFQGKFQSALELCERARATFPEENRVVGITEHEILKLLGRFEEARRALIQSRDSTPAFIPRLEDRSSAASELAVSMLAAEAGNVREARESYLIGRTVLEGDNKLMAFADALHAWILALEGGSVEAADQIVYAEGRVANIAGSASTQRDVFQMLARAALIIGDYGNAQRYAERYLELRPYPAYATIAYYLLGESHLGLGEIAQAADAYERAITLNCATYAAGQALVRIDEIKRPLG